MCANAIRKVSVFNCYLSLSQVLSFNAANLQQVIVCHYLMLNYYKQALAHSLAISMGYTLTIDTTYSQGARFVVSGLSA